MTVYTGFAAVTPSDTDAIPPTQALYVGVSGDIAAVSVNGDTVTFKAAPVGVLPVQVKQVKATGTTATNILALR